MNIAYKLPDISEQSKYTFPLTWLNKQYSLTLINNSRSDDVILEITMIDSNSNEIVVAKNIKLSTNIDLMNSNYSENWEGRLYIFENNGLDKVIDSSNLHSDFYMVLITEDEFG